eukprot:14425371-Ditylum_brightwellii.AAC.1
MPSSTKAINGLLQHLLYSTCERNKPSSWLEVKKESTEHVPETSWANVEDEELLTVVKSLKNWSSLGLNQVHNYWYKQLFHLHKRLRNAATVALQHPDTLPEWFTYDRTTLLYKSDDENVVRNYCPITCLPTGYKLLMLIIINRVYKHIVDHDILPPEQKGMKRKAR